MNRNILRAGAAAVAAMLSATLAVAAPAQASVGPHHGSAVRVVAPPAPDGWGSGIGVSLASVPSPTISPSTFMINVAPGGIFYCYLDNLCTTVWDPNYLWVDGQGGARLGGWAIFFMYDCHEYELSNWLGDGTYVDNQTPAGLRGVRSYFRNQFHNQIGNYITPDNTQHGPYDWDPVWYIKNC
jgi:hypothetical protein